MPSRYRTARHGLASTLLGALLVWGSDRPAHAVVTVGEASGYGVSANVLLGGPPTLVVPITPAAGNIAPVPFNDNANLPSSNFTALYGIYTIGESDTGELDINFSSTVDGAPGVRSASADATVDEVSIQNFTQVPPIFPVTLDAVLDLQATEIMSMADVTGDFGGLVPTGSASLSGTAGPGNDQASITSLGVEFLLKKNPVPNETFFITPNDVPGLEGHITVIQNEQILNGNGSDMQSITVNALHLIIGTGMIKLPPNDTDAVWNGEVIVAQSRSALQAEMDPDTSGVPEPSTLALAIAGLLLSVFNLRRRMRD